MKQMQTENNTPSQCMAAEAAVAVSAGEKKRFRLRPVIIAAFILLLVLLFGVVLHAVGINVWRLIVTWDDETMEMRMDTQGRIIRRGYVNDFDTACDDAFFQKLEELEITPLLPSRLPDGFVLELVESKIETEYCRWALGTYTLGERLFHISVEKNVVRGSGGITFIEKDEREPDIYERGGVNFYVIDNLKRSGAFWFDPPYFLNISGHLSRDEIKQMIDSMFERK